MVADCMLCVEGGMRDGGEAGSYDMGEAFSFPTVYIT